MSHVRDVYFLMITMALGMVLWGLSFRWIPVTGGDNGISGIPRLEALVGLPASGPIPFYYVALLVFAVCMALDDACSSDRRSVSHSRAFASTSRA